MTLCQFISIVLAQLLLAHVAFGQVKPTVLISGEGNISIESVGVGAAGANRSSVAAGGATHKAINKHDQTKEIAQDLLTFCPAVEATLDDQAAPDYFVSLTREGHPTIFGELGSSQVMVLNARKVVIFVGKKATVKNGVKSACNAIAADWQANGRIIPPPISAVAPASVAKPLADGQVAQSVRMMDVALVMRTTARADKYCKPQTIASVLSDTVAYLTSKGLTLGNVASSKIILVMIVDRPISKWIEITVQGQDLNSKILWSEKVSDAGWGHLGEQGLLNALDKVHRVIDARLPPRGSS